MITSWRAAVAGAITFVPGLADFRSVGTGGTDSARYCYSVWLRHVAAAERAGVWHGPTHVAELGPGDSLGIGLAALLSGVERYYAFDVVAHASPARNLSIFDELVAMFAARQPIPDETEFPLVKPYLDDYRFPAEALPEERLAQALAPERVARLRADLEALGQDAAGDRPDAMEARSIRYVVPWMSQGNADGESPSVAARPAPGSLDMIFSQAVMEHVDDLPGAYHAMREWLRSDGFISHQVDFKCHGTAREWNGHWRASDLEWKLIRGRKPFLINRQPCSVQLAALARAGFELCLEKRVRSESPVTRGQLARRFRDLSDDDLTTSGVYLLARPRRSS